MSSKIKNLGHLGVAICANILYGFPSRKLKLVGVTGTDGKTTTVSMIYSVLKKAGKKVAMISTVKAVIGQDELETGLHTTTPNAMQLQALLRKMVEKGVEYAVIEVSSHALEQFRVWGCNFEISVVTNVTPEHLDYHLTMENYMATKARLFKVSQRVVLNSTDASFESYGQQFGSKVAGVYPDKNIDKRILEVIGRKFAEPYNMLNAQACVMVTKCLGLKPAQIAAGLSEFEHVCGRMEKIATNRGFNVFVDFAHTPNALKSVLGALKKKSKGRLICVFGCAGLRDVNKRVQMSQIAIQNADLSVFTAEDPRTEDIGQILVTMSESASKAGGKLGRTYYLLPERGEAIAFAINKLARKNDTVVVCGKGHERSMAYGKTEYPWSDQEAVRSALAGKVMKIERTV